MDTGEEQVEEGSVGLKVYWEYFKDGNGYLYLSIFFILSVITQVCLVVMKLPEWTCCIKGMQVLRVKTIKLGAVRGDYESIILQVRSTVACCWIPTDTSDCITKWNLSFFQVAYIMGDWFLTYWWEICSIVRKSFSSQIQHTFLLFSFSIPFQGQEKSGSLQHDERSCGRDSPGSTFSHSTHHILFQHNWYETGRKSCLESKWNSCFLESDFVTWNDSVL